jgi:hypothetical protein
MFGTPGHQQQLLFGQSQYGGAQSSPQQQALQQSQPGNSSFGSSSQQFQPGPRYMTGFLHSAVTSSTANSVGAARH